jgi:hypothetical protein
LTNQAITINDTPQLLGTDMFTLEGDQVDQLLVSMTFHLYVAVRTSD